MADIRTIALPDGETIPAMGIGTWNMGDKRQKRADEIVALQTAVDLGMTVIDTAEMYGAGAAETLVAEAIGDRRSEIFLVSKVMPQHASRRGTITACEASLRRLKTDRLDMYLLHWRGSVPLAETMDAFKALQHSGKIRHYGVSNLDLADMQELWKVPGGSATATNQVLYNLMRRGIEWDLLPQLREWGVPVMAYSPIEQGKLVRNRKLADFAQRHGMTPATAALAWLLASDDVIVIPKTGNRERLRENLAAVEIRLTTAQLAELDQLFPPPKGPRPLEML